ncbi:MAG: GDP-fucose synthetase [Legionellales bacterium RIFCSPHIGHO2_12_FULL_35_11]|nr:MAG: GDP-fucose synthetase [Legionellales bacterium RIFCSPHIGHO2_12_FULL_35_11]
MHTTKIFIAGHTGMVGSAIVRRLQTGGYKNLIVRTHQELDLTNQIAVHTFFNTEKPDYVFLAAAKVGGIQANNTYRAEFIYQNLMIQTNVIHAAMQADVRRLLFLGSSCIYPRECPQPIKEEYLLHGPLESTNEPYATAKIAGIKLCESYNQQYGTKYVSVMPTNLYGINDNYDLNNSHALPALLRKAHEAKHRGDKKIIVWGTGTPKREWLYVDDMADACVFIMEQSIDSGIFNIGTGVDLDLKSLTEMVMEIVGFTGWIEFDTTKPDGVPRKWLNIERLRNLGWIASTELRQGLIKTYQDFLLNECS